MRGMRGEVDYSITKPSKGLTREQMREQIAADMAAFEATKKVEVLPTGATGFEPCTKNSIINKLSQKSKAKPASRVWNDAGGKK